MRKTSIIIIPTGSSFIFTTPLRVIYILKNHAVIPLRSE
nr:MAG TPA: hypothetical protein [Caudoviricetes sp.]